MRVFDLERLQNGSRRYIKYSFLFVRAEAHFYILMVFVLIGVATLLGMSAYFFGLFDPDSLRAEGISGEYDSGFRYLAVVPQTYFRSWSMVRGLFCAFNDHSYWTC